MLTVYSSSMFRFRTAFLAVLLCVVAAEPLLATALVNDYGAGALVGPLARQALGQLVIKGRAPMTGYSRDMFGSAWSDVDGNGCDQRDDALWRASFGHATRTDGCTVTRATVIDVYTGKTITYIRGGDYANGLDIDHVVALGDAWSSGVGYKSSVVRLHLANDPLNLLAVDPSSNRQKGDSNAASWLPPRTAYRCSYVARQIAVKRKYALSITPSERDAMARVLQGCPLVRIPAGGLPPLSAAAVKNVRTPSGTGSEVTAPSGSAGGGQDPLFSSCAKAKAAGYGPYVSGRDVEYTWYRDGDNDGTVCE
jgi:hypothetical protein